MLPCSCCIIDNKKPIIISEQLLILYSAFTAEQLLQLTAALTWRLQGYFSWQGKIPFEGVKDGCPR